MVEYPGWEKGMRCVVFCI